MWATLLIPLAVLALALVLAELESHLAGPSRRPAQRSPRRLRDTDLPSHSGDRHRGHSPAADFPDVAVTSDDRAPGEFRAAETLVATQSDGSAVGPGSAPVGNVPTTRPAGLGRW